MSTQCFDATHLTYNGSDQIGKPIVVDEVGGIHLLPHTQMMVAKDGTWLSVDFMDGEDWWSWYVGEYRA